MMLKKITVTGFLFFSCMAAFAQQGNTVLKTYRIAVFSPLYLDSVFDAGTGNYKYGKNFPRFTQQGLDFVQGAQIALDSMPLPDGNIQASFFDSKSIDQNISRLIATHKLDSMDLLIGAVKDTEFIQLAAFAKRKNIPFVSAAYPNDGGVTANPFLIIVNSTLRAHCENIYSYLLQNHGTDNIFLVRKKGSQEDKIAAYFKALNEADGKPLLTMHTLNFEDDFSSLKDKLDSNRRNVIIGGSLNEEFANNLTAASYSLKKKYTIELIGMPNWDGFADIKQPAYKDFPILYTTPYCNSRTDSFSRMVQAAYLKKYKGSPSDMSYKGFECIYLFTALLAHYPNDFISHLNDSSYKLFSNYNFKPVYLNKKNSIPDYFENKHLFFMKILNGKAVKLM
jgi:hypothetical protein